MKKGIQKKLRILEISLWSMFFIVLMAFLNNYLMEERLLFYKTDQEKIILGSSWGKSSDEVLIKSQYKSDELSVKYYSKINLNGREIDFGRNFFKIIEGCSFDIDGYSAKVDYTFYNDQLFAIRITGNYYGYGHLISKKYDEFKNECSNILFFLKTRTEQAAKAELIISDEDLAPFFDGFMKKCIYTENLDISYISWDKGDDTQFIIKLIYKPIIKEIEQKY